MDINAIYLKLKQKIWFAELRKAGLPRRALIKTARVVFVLAHDYRDTQMQLWAMSLVYTTLLGLVPFLAVSFSVLKAFGVQNQLAPVLMNLLAPLGEQAVVIAQKIITFVSEMRVGVLGAVGLAMLFYTVISIVQKIEQALNYIWKVKEERSFAQKFTEYMSIILTGPVLIFGALGFTATVMSNRIVRKILSIPHFGPLFVFLTGLLPYIFVIFAFTLVYYLLPNAKVKIKSALVGGTFAGIAWQTIGLAYAAYIASNKSYSAVYSSFAIIILFLIWLYFIWQIFLLGAALTFYNQYPSLLSIQRGGIALSNRFKERLSLVLMYLIGKGFYRGERRWTIESFMRRLGLPMEAVREVLEVLEQKGLILEYSEDSTNSYVPAKALENITVREILESVRTIGEADMPVREEMLHLPSVDEEVHKINLAVSGALDSDTLKDLILSPEPAETT